jgi:acyl transferase domain-containing protein/NAD(P)H-dependent flavin oxidoreductase YrpB (nitropropane dioxygenase family)/NAD(P)-dependent dehydrogenase (short-subunit alcohol dehydrogenase family)/acyl carrier protein
VIGDQLPDTTPSGLDRIVLSPAGRPDIRIPLAGARAGAVGMLDLEFSVDLDEALTAVSTLVERSRGRIGVLLDVGSPLLKPVLERAGEALTAVALGIGPAGVGTAGMTALRDAVAAVHRRGAAVLVIATCAEHALAGQEAGADAIIAKGHEAAGWVGDESAFVLAQRCLSTIELPVWIHGGIGLHTAAAALVAGATGVVLDSQLLLTRESPLPAASRTVIERMDGSEALWLGADLNSGVRGDADTALRVYQRPGLPPVLTAQAAATTLLTGTADGESPSAAVWRGQVVTMVDWDDLQTHLLTVGQDGCFAADLARRFRTVGGVLAGIEAAVQSAVEVIRADNPIREGSPFATSHGTRYPIVQGPMTRVSDRAEFAAAVVQNGALPFLALSLLRGAEVNDLMIETRELVGELPWGVGILGFLPQELRDDQMEVVRRVKPPFAVIAGGRPAQARDMEADGIATYLHVPSPGLLSQFLRDGATRFIFEGRECGGHVGPRTSFVLWELAIRTLLAELPNGAKGSDYHIIFAGGIHDARSSAMVAAVMAPLVERGINVAVLAGTAYLFTDEAVSTGAITEEFRDAALRCDTTTLLESGPGHATRCAPSPFTDDFRTVRHGLIRDGVPHEEMRERLEALNLGRLRVASKGLDRPPAPAEDAADGATDADAEDLRAISRTLVSVSSEQRWERGMFMIGQVAALRASKCTLAELHADLSQGSTEWLASLAALELPEEPTPAPADIAVIGMGCILPGAPDLESFWTNILGKVDAVSEVPADRWDWRRYFDPERSAKDKVYSRWGGFVDDVLLEPIPLGMPPNTLNSIEPFQLLGLMVARSAIQDAGYEDRPFPRERTGVIFGAGGGGGDLSVGYTVRSSLPQLFGAEDAAEITEELGASLPTWTEDSFPGILMNVVSGRIANRLDLGGPNFTVDAACASSLAAIALSVRDLQSGITDMAVAGGIDAIQNPFSYLCFSKTQALSPTGRCRPFDATADGIAIAEGFAAVVLKRLADAERDGDRIYAVIKGVGAGSDGRDRSLTAPRPEGQMRALRRAYAQADLSPSTVTLVEAHGTGTVAGDKAEHTSLSTIFNQAGAPIQGCAIGSVKSMIGHTKATAGVAGMIKTVLALHNRVLPPTLGVTVPNPKAKFHESPFYVNTEARPWVRTTGAPPRRAGLSAFGFGGTNFHIVLEEYSDAVVPDARTTLKTWPAELFVFRAPNREKLADSVASVLAQIEAGAQPRLSDLAGTLADRASSQKTGPVLALVATGLEDLETKLKTARTQLAGEAKRLHTPDGVHFAENAYAGAESDGKIAFLFPGQGSQIVDMARDIATVFPVVREAFDEADEILAERWDRPLSRFVFPPPVFTDDERNALQSKLTATSVAQPALGATELGYLRLLRSFGVEPDMTAGHSYGEFVALAAGGSVSERDMLRISEARGRFIEEGAGEDSGAMAGITASPEAISELLDQGRLTLANLNSPKQTVVAGSSVDIEAAVTWCKEHKLGAKRLSVACAFHSPFVAGARERLGELLSQTAFQAPRIPVYSNSTGMPYPHEVGEIVSILSEHLVRPVKFVDEITAMHNDGARVFVEVGPKTVLSGLTDAILGEAEHVTVSVDRTGRTGVVQILHALAALISEGAAVDLGVLFADRGTRRLDLRKIAESGEAKPSRAAWVVNGGRARPLGAPEPIRPTVSVRALASVGASATSHPDGVAAGSHTESITTVPTTSSNGAALNGFTTPGAPTPNGSTSPGSAQNGFANGHIPTGAAANGNGQHLTGASPSASAPVAPTPTAAHHSQEAPVTALAPASNGASHHPGVSPQLPPASGAITDVMARYQVVMQQFLDTQRSVMLAYLNGAEDGPIGAPMAPMSYAPSLPAVAPQAALPSAAPYVPPAPAYAPPVEAAVAPAPPPAATPPPPAAAAPAPAPVAAPAPAAAPAPVAAPVPAAPAGLTADQITEQVLSVVSGRTGYPEDMLDLEADLEADLGIDSIKRVEIAGLVFEGLPLPDGFTPDLEKLTSSKTLQQVIDSVNSMVGPSATVDTAARPFSQEPSDNGRIGRLAVSLTNAPALPAVTGRAGLNLSPTGSVLVLAIDESIGARIGTPLVEKLRALDEDAQLISPTDVPSVVASLREGGGRVKAVLVTAPAQPAVETTSLIDAVEHLLVPAVQLLQASRTDLMASAQDGGAAVLLVAGMGGALGIAPSAPDSGESAGAAPANLLAAAPAALSGLAKSVAQEFDGVRSKIVDLDLESLSADDAATLLVAELGATDPLTEIGHRGGERLTPALLPTELGERPADGNDVLVDLPAGAVVLITGGARGITAAAAAQLARRGKPLTLVLVGRTPPPQAEGSETAGITDMTALKRALIDRERAAGTKVTPAAIERAYRGVLAEREVRDNLSGLAAAGATVDYRSCDVTDHSAFGALIQDVYDRYGRIDGAVHGAGVIEDKLLQDKELASLQRVLRTKIVPLQVMATALRPEGLRFLVLFSSVAARFGNRGQADYASAGEVLNKVAQVLAAQWPTRVVSINWGPWQTTGMVSEEVQKQFAERGIALIPVATGCRIFEQELERGYPGEVEVVVAGTVGAESDADDVGAGFRPASAGSGQSEVGSPISSALPLLVNAELTVQTGDGGLRVIRRLDPETDRFLDDHRIDGTPVMPFAGCLELMAETAAAGSPDLTVIGLRDIRLFKGVTLDQGPETVELVASPVPTAGEGASRTVEVVMKSTGGPKRGHYRALVDLAAASPAPSAPTDGVDLSGQPKSPFTVEQAYQEQLFHGPLFQSIETINVLGPAGALAKLRPSVAAECIRGLPAIADWLIDPIVFDTALQTQVLWAQSQWGMTLLPLELGEVRRFAGFGPGPVSLELRVRPKSAPPLCRADYIFKDATGAVLVTMTGMVGAGSPALNRLAGQKTAPGGQQ